MAKIKKQYKERYTVVLNKLIEDKRLSYKAVGLFIDLWHSPDDWDYYLSEIVNRHTDGKDSVKSGLAELERYGYLRRSNKHRNENGTFDSYDWDLSETPIFNQSGKTAADNHRVGKTAADNPPLQNTNPLSTKNNKVLKDKNNNNTSSENSILNNPYTAFESQICKLNAYQRVEFLDWQKEFGNDVLLFAIKHICTTDLRTTWGTFNWLIKTWHDHNLKSLSDVKDYEKQNYEANKAKRSYKSSKPKKKAESYGQGEYAVEKAKADRGEFPF